MFLASICHYSGSIAGVSSTYYNYSSRGNGNTWPDVRVLVPIIVSLIAFILLVTTVGIYLHSSKHKSMLLMIMRSFFEINDNLFSLSWFKGENCLIINRTKIQLYKNSRLKSKPGISKTERRSLQIPVQDSAGPQPLWSQW